MQSKKIGIIGAMDIEVENLKVALADCKITKIAEMEFYEGILNKKNVVIVKSGIGKVNSARCAQILCDKFNVDIIVNTGIGGGVGEGLDIEDMIIGDELCQHDFDVTGFGYPKGYMFLGDKDKITVFKSDEYLVECAKKASKIHMPDEKIKIGRIATGDIFVNSSQKRLEIRNEFGALVCEMEGGAIAQCASANNVPFVVLRTISDLADGLAVDSYEEFEKRAAYLCGEIIKSFVEVI